MRFPEQIINDRMSGELLTLQEASEKYNIPCSTLKAWIQSQDIIPIRITSRIMLIKAKEVEQRAKFYYPRLNARKKQK